MTVTLKIAGIYTGPKWRHRRSRKQRRILGMTPDQWAARCKQVGLPYEEHPKGATRQ